MKNFKKVLSKTVASVYTAHTYGEAIRKPLRKVYQKPLRRFTSQTRMPTGIRGYRIKRGVAFQMTGMQSIPEHHVNRGVGLRGHALPKTFGKALPNEGYAAHTPTLRKPKFRFRRDPGRVCFAYPIRHKGA